MKFASTISLAAALFAGVAGSSASASSLTAAAPMVVGPAPLYGAKALGPAAAASSVDFSVVLPYRNAAELQALLVAQTDPKSKNYHQFLSAAQFRSYFAPTVAAYTAAAVALQKQGFKVTTFANRTVLHAVGSASAVEHYFGTTLAVVRQPNGRLAHANVTSLRVPAALAGARITGLSSIIVAKTGSSERSAPSTHQTNVVGGTLFGPDGGFGPTAIDVTEDLPVEHGYRGANSNVADLIDGRVSDSDVAGYLSYFGIKRGGPRTTAIQVDGGCGAIGCFDTFQAEVDAEGILGAAPDASLFTYQIPDLTNSGIADGVNAIVSDDAVNIASISFAACEISGGDLQLAIEPIIAQGAAEGITFDGIVFGGANDCQLNIPLPLTPANLDTVTAVGGSTAIVGNSGTLLAQSTYANSNGGISATIPLPAWQASTPGINPAGRNVPDVVLPAAVDGVGPSIYFNGAWVGGSAFVNNAPFAGYLATVQQYYGYQTPLGNVAVPMYQVFNAYAYAKGYFSDISVGNIGSINGVPVLATKGYDIASGIGSIKGGFGLMKALGYTPAQ